MNKQHWDNIHATKKPSQVSWFAPHLENSLQLIDRIKLPPNAAIIDIGGGQSSLVEDLLDRGFQDLSVLDISQAAIDAHRKRLADSADRVHWLVNDITTAPLQSTRYHLWHDRAVFHFLTTSQDRAAYLLRLKNALKPGGHVILATFGLDGPIRCSGLETVRYSATTLHRELGSRFRLIESSTQKHITPSGATQQFLYCHFQLS